MTGASLKQGPVPSDLQGMSTHTEVRSARAASRRLMRALKGLGAVPCLLALLAPAGAGASVVIIGSPLSVPATLNTAENLNYEGTNTVVPPAPDAPNGIFHTFHYGADTAIWNVAQAVGSPVVPVDGAVNRISLEGCAEPAAGGPAPLTEFHVQDISPIPNGGERVNLSSQGFQLPVCGAGGASGSSRVYTNGALEARAAARHWWSITSWTMFSSERVGRQPISACTFAMSGTRRYMSSKPSAYASS